jgi:dTDP-4-amino-4,6-dideoxygalactose transaminase
MNELSAAMGLTQLDTFAGTLAWNFKNYEAYRRRFKTLPGLKLLSYPKGERMNYHYIVIEINERKTGLSRDALVQVLMAENVVARRYFTPGVHRMEPYRSQARHAGISLPITERLADILFCLPTGMAISEEEIDVVGDILQAALSEPARVRTVLAKRGAR